MIAKIKPTPGDACGGSDHTLGETWPPGSEPTGNDTHDINNIFEITEPTPNGGQVVVGWTYTLVNGQQYVEENAHEASFWANFLAELPPLGAFTSALDAANAGALVPATAADVNSLITSNSKGGGHSGSCFNAPLYA